MRIIAIVGLVVLVGALSLGALAGAALFGSAPTCPEGPGAARSEKALGDAIERGGVTIPDAEATAIVRRYVGSAVEYARACATSGAGHLSGQIPLGPLHPAFYASGSVDLSGTTPRVVNLHVRVGAVPTVPYVTGAVEEAVTNLINTQLAGIRLTKHYAIVFSDGSVTIRRQE